MGMELIKPNMLNKGDKVAAVSLSWGGAGEPDLLHRYNRGKKVLEEQFGLQVIEMPHTLKGAEYVYKHPQERAKDLMAAFADPSIKGIFSCIGGDESVRLLPYIDYSIIRNNPKVFIGYSDTTVTHMVCRRAGISSFYGPSILAEFAENVKLFDYTAHWVQKSLFTGDIIGSIEASPVWTSEHLPWEDQSLKRERKMEKHEGYEVLQGEGTRTGRLIGGCIEVLEMLKGTDVWPSLAEWEGSIIFFETSEDKTEPKYIEYWLRNYGSQGILQKASALLFGKPYDNSFYEEYKEVIVRVVRDELGLSDLPIFFNMNFGHTSPMCVLPYGARATVDCENRMFSIEEPGTI
ncbi:S66 peptidase family protein [Bacillus sp. 1P06AnD]|uniref:S66 family peptidase n=1 Tax=Bacillus sp. 1P06AnD TaxID=3132208 RepID=UPI0039A2B244